MAGRWSRDQAIEAKQERKHLASVTLSGKHASTGPYQGGTVSVSGMVEAEDAERVLAVLNRISGAMPRSSRYSIVDRKKLEKILASTGMSAATISRVLTELET